MTKYGRTYTPPVFHLEKASEKQVMLMQTVFSTLAKSDVEFVVVYPNEYRSNELNIRSYGDFSLNEKEEIITEVAEMYLDEDEINQITMV